MITTHSLSADAFTALAGGAGDSVVVRQLHEAQLSKHLMLLRVVAEAARASPAVAALPSAVSAFRAGYQLLARGAGRRSRRRGRAARPAARRQLGA